MKISERRRFGRAAFDVTAFSFGTVPLGNIFNPVDEATSETIVDQAWDDGIRYFDVAPSYGHGLAELRLGHALRWKKRDDYVLSTKVGRVLKPARRETIDFTPWVDAAANKPVFDYSYDGTMRSFEDSLQRMALEQIDILFIHDIDVFTHGADQPAVFDQAMDGCWKALETLRGEGLVKAVGVGVNEWQVCHDALRRRDFDCFLLAGRYTLLEQEALDEFLPLCAERGAAVVVGGGFNSGILATGARPGAKYNYAPAPDAVIRRVAAIETVCHDYDVPLAAAALQFVVAHPVVASFCAGARNPAQLAQSIDWFDRPIPPDFWSELKRKGLLREDAPVPQ